MIVFLRIRWIILRLLNKNLRSNDYGLLEIEKGKDLCTLLTCTPYGVNTHRLLVRGHRVENVMDEKNLMADATRVNPLVVAGVIGLILYGIGYVAYRMKRKRERGKICKHALCLFHNSYFVQGPN